MDQIHTLDDLKKASLNDAFREELGDVLLQVLLNSAIAQEVGAFDVYDVAEALSTKMIARHPHVFASEKLGTSEEVLQNWEKRKAAEKAAKGLNASVLDGVPRGFPALLRASRTIEKVTRVGFQWPTLEGPLAKAEEELAELKSEIMAYEASRDSAEREKLREKIEDELGDALFTLANLGYLLKIQPEDALRKQLARFETRFRHVEGRVKENGGVLDKTPLEEMDRYWDEAKKLEGRK
jgi:MazG family protein